MDSSEVKSDNHKLVLHRGFSFISGTHDPDEVDQINNLEIRDTDVFVITYPKSGTIWLQQILRLIETRGDIPDSANMMNSDCVPWIELVGKVKEFITAPSPRLRVTHLQYKFMPLALSQKKGKVIYVARNPKDVLVSYFYFHKLATMLETPENFSIFFEKFIRGDVFGGCWFEHIKSWYSHKDDMNILFITYEEMVQNLHLVVKKISSFLGKDLTDQQQANVVKYSTFRNMKQIPQANYQLISDQLLDHQQGTFMRKGTIGDWKNHFTVAQSEKFDQVFQKEMKDFPLSFIWDMNDTV
ncbi:amine sulfotransferase-like [Myripristis murdjan]|uniref:amine sulfotransferase-like n=1 Tax=Myripristis murdjan TaxID=586833 RepID=UPI0011762A71|nr:amine sulfotransferase-like [Myripristis murdjan]XP_029928315.1 amine sulfotransferase-like [Myripristis murdjan]